MFKILKYKLNKCKLIINSKRFKSTFTCMIFILLMIFTLAAFIVIPVSLINSISKEIPIVQGKNELSVKAVDIIFKETTPVSKDSVLEMIVVNFDESNDKSNNVSEYILKNKMTNIDSNILERMGVYLPANYNYPRIPKDDIELIVAEIKVKLKEMNYYQIQELDNRKH